MRNKKETIVLRIAEEASNILSGIFASSRDLNSTTEAKLSKGLTHVEGAYLNLNRRCFVTDGREEGTIEIDGVEDG